MCSRAVLVVTVVTVPAGLGLGLRLSKTQFHLEGDESELN